MSHGHGKGDKGDSGGGGHPAGIPKTGGGREIDAASLTDTREFGAPVDGERQSLDRRLYMQLLAFGNCTDTSHLPHLIDALKKGGFPAVLYADINDPRGIALLTMNEDPEFFTTTLRKFLNSGAFAALQPKPEYTMLGRTYSIGYEKRLEDWLIHRPPRVVTNPDWQWAVWYPLKRKGPFALLGSKEQGEILMEHGIIGRAFGKAGLGHDIRLACYGIDKFDNDFVIGLIGAELAPLSMLVEAMRKTKQTSTHIEKMGPFFIGKAVWQRTG